MCPRLNSFKNYVLHNENNYRYYEHKNQLFATASNILTVFLRAREEGKGFRPELARGEKKLKCFEQGTK